MSYGVNILQRSVGFQKIFLSKQILTLNQKSQQKQKTQIFIKDFNMPDFWLDIFVYFP